jgi:hypothetical protein
MPRRVNEGLAVQGLAETKSKRNFALVVSAFYCLAASAQIGSLPPVSDTLNLIWGMAAIAKALGKSERSLYHIVEKHPDALPGVKKIAGTWCCDPAVFKAAMRGEVAIAPSSKSNGHALPPMPGVSAHA